MYLLSYSHAVKVWSRWRRLSRDWVNNCSLMNCGTRSVCASRRWQKCPTVMRCWFFSRPSKLSSSYMPVCAADFSVWKLFQLSTISSFRFRFRFCVCVCHLLLTGDKRGDYQNCSVLYCVAKLCTVTSTLRWAVLSVRCFVFFWHWAYLTVRRFICVYVFVFCVRIS